MRDSELVLVVSQMAHAFPLSLKFIEFLDRGLYRVHQFSKVEMFVFCRPEESDSYHEELIQIEEDLFSSLGLHFK